MNPDTVTAALWVAWVVSWWAAAFWQDRAVKRPSAAGEVAHRLIVVAGGLLLFNAFRQDSLRLLLWTPGPLLKWAMVALVAAGLLFTWWARISLARLWSSGITRKADHHVVDTGPYAIVRHPIYTGVILAQMATGVQIGSMQAMLGAALMFAGWYVKARMEESFLREQLGRDAYNSYARRVPMLIPFARV